jgi:hypothetical protein
MIPAPGKGQFWIDASMIPSPMGIGLNVGALAQSNPNAPIDIRIHMDRDLVDPRMTRIFVFREYCKGWHTNILTPRQKQILRNLLSHRFCDNVCHQIIHDGVGRVRFLRYVSKDEKVNDFLADLYRDNKLEDRQTEIHYDQGCDGNTYLGVAYNYDTKKVNIYREPSWDGSQGMFTAYDIADQPLYSVKEWFDIMSMKIRVVYLPDQILRFTSTTGAIGSWEPYQLNDDTQWPMMWVNPNTYQPLGIPVVHMPNPGRGNGNYGWSDLQGVPGYQDQLNDLQFAMSATGRQTAYQMYYVSGYRRRTNTPPNLQALQKRGDEAGGPDGQGGLEAGPGQVWTSTSPDTSFGVLPAGDCHGLIELYDKKLERIAMMTSTPLSVLKGITDKSDDIKPAVAKAWMKIGKARIAYIEVAKLAIKLENAYGKGGLDEDAIIDAQFADPEMMDPISQASFVQKVSPQLSIRESIRRLGYSKDQAESIYQEILEEAKDKEAIALTAMTGNTGKASGLSTPGSDPTQANSETQTPGADVTTQLRVNADV